ncbi:hypothetical protein [Sporosarcina sp. 6E9]|uniref:hypothetical protein n=1 Tax=Sporosarcina sp. 6E9 TaxID=2819235 RepID=UPI001B30FACC|nr:hypothetical protein [Sporosarcina sp. 6E9]
MNNFNEGKLPKKQQYSQSLNAIGPDFTIPGQYDGDQNMGNYQRQQQDTHPALFDQNQLEDGHGPVYAVPPFPPDYNLDQSTESQGLQQDTHPALFDQNQMNHGFGPIYAVPAYPWPHSQSPGTGSSPMHQDPSQNMGTGNWPQGGNHNQAMTPYYWRCPHYMYPVFGVQYHR